MCSDTALLLGLGGTKNPRGEAPIGLTRGVKASRGLGLGLAGSTGRRSRVGSEGLLTGIGYFLSREIEVRPAGETVGATKTSLAPTVFHGAKGSEITTAPSFSTD